MTEKAAKKKGLRDYAEGVGDGFRDGFEPLEPLDLRKIKSFDDLARAMSKTAFQGRNLGEAVDVFEAMVKDPDCFVVLTISGAMTPAKMGLIVCDMIDHEMVDAVITTGALMTHGFVEAQGMTHFKYKPDEMDDRELYYKGYDRIYDVLELEKNLDDTELIVRDVFNKFDSNETLSSKKICEELGKYLKEHTKGRGILKSAYEKKIPVYIPAFTDCELGLDFGLYNIRQKIHKKPTLKFDPFIDLEHFAELIKKQKTIGVFTVGGGVPRNWAQQIAPYLDLIRFRIIEKEDPSKYFEEKGPYFKRYKYGVRICPEPVNWGGLCLHKDTKIEIPRNLKKHPEGIPIKKLIGKSNIPVYSFDRNNKRVSLSNIRRVNFAWISGWGQEGKKLNNNYIIASADHKFLMRNGEYKKVAELKENDRLMPFNAYYKSDTHGKYRFISLDNGKKIAEHQFIGKYILGRPLAVNEVIHHRDSNTLNNNLDNLIVMDKREHVSYHRSVETEETKQKRAKTLSQISDPNKMKEKSMKFWNNLSKEEYNLLCLQRKETALQPEEKIRRSITAKSYWKSLPKEERKIRLKNAHNSTKKRWQEMPLEIRSQLVSNEKNPRFIKGISEEMVKYALIKENGSILNAAKRLGISIKVFNKRKEIYNVNRNWIKENCIENHFVTSVEYFGEDETYDITVDNTHNFVANGIIVSNSGCTYSEGVSWGKFVPKSEGGRWAEVLCDATIAWPIIVKAVMERMGIK